MRRRLKANFMVEAVAIVPLIFMVIAVLISILFYYHDKNVIRGVAHETVVLFSYEEHAACEEIEEYFQEGLRRKLLVFQNVQVEIGLEDDEIQMRCTARRNGMNINIETRMKRTQPEVWIRRARLVKQLGDKLGE